MDTDLTWSVTPPFEEMGFLFYTTHNAISVAI